MIFITEVNPKNARYKLTEAELDLAGYDLWYNMREGRGVLIYTQKSLHAEPVQNDSEFHEAIVISVKLRDGDRLLAGCVYRSPSSSKDDNAELNKLLNVCLKNYSHLLFTGDFNYGDINWLNWTTPQQDIEADEYKFLETCKDNFLYQHVSEPTRGRLNNQPTLLDLVLTNEEDMVEEVEHLSPLGESDHCILSFRFRCYTMAAKTTRNKYLYDKADYEKLREKLNLD